MPLLSSPAKPADGQFERLLADAFRQAGWNVAHSGRGKRRSDLLIRRGKLAYAVGLKRAPEGRRDRLIPLLAQAILQAQAFAREGPARAVPLAVIAAPRVPDALADEVRRFASEYAPGVAAGVIDLEGFRAFVGDGLEPLNAQRQRARPDLRAKANASPDLFSDLNQWMLKVLLAPRIPEDLLSAPRGEYRNASQLAQAAGVSVMSAFRFVRMLQGEGFLDESVKPLRLVRIDELMRRWRAAYLRPVREWPMRWILRRETSKQLEEVVRQYAAPQASASRAHRRNHRPPSPRLCLGLFAAADALEFGFVHGVKPHLYVEEVRPDVLQRLGLSRAEPGQPADVQLRVPPAPQSVFRGAVLRNGLPVSDILQVWLDVAEHPSRGDAQAREIQRRVLRPLFAGK